ncbi:UDP-N-acetylmuramate dehydrogenase [Flavobacteriaceae bacterium TP-CH-4]|uniref:UDP-N-acetylenolpyruvoylglucosamine reductase n=1 Tax=Pelagihabitans pacificus TaxID=2696054 RepID=A0A967EC05_9FLAO|nr:UDP-N-acetylmuramate dehydrogenase [Pelagihabitans pacificus]NHF60781.1 UDP-N-acetylmuramate dehydrogenase [Pelagihabitans pacificus]
MQIQENKSLTRYNTFGIKAKARFFCEVHSIKDLREVLRMEQYPKKFILGGGSNMLLTKDIDALVLYINMKGKEVVSQNETHVFLKVMAGENWHELVLWTMEQDYGGLENMSLIPGNTGTAPIQNIGAYGVELKDSFVGCDAMKLDTREIYTFTKEDCQFGYRDSFFKNEGKGKYIVTSVTFKLTKKNHQLNTSYGDIETQLQKNAVKEATIQEVSKAVIAIRQSKLPDPSVLGNSGSFFKNPVVDKEVFKNFTGAHPDAPYYKVSDDLYKIPAGWLIEKCGFKGKRFGDAGVHKHQALVLVNYGNATGTEILHLAQRIMKSVEEKFGIIITPEVNIID